MRINPKIVSAIFFGGWITFGLFLIMPEFMPLWIADYIAVLILAKKLTKREPSIYDVWEKEID